MMRLSRPLTALYAVEDLLGCSDVGDAVACRERLRARDSCRAAGRAGLHGCGVDAVSDEAAALIVDDVLDLVDGVVDEFLEVPRLWLRTGCGLGYLREHQQAD